MRKEQGRFIRQEVPQPAELAPEVVLFDVNMPVNRRNRAANVAIAHGVFVNGIYRDHGIPRPPKEQRPQKI
jgi:hypothetical protein